MMVDFGPYRVRKRERFCSYPKEGFRAGAWTEYQVVLGAKVLSRWDFEDKAIKDAEARLADLRAREALP